MGVWGQHPQQAEACAGGKGSEHASDPCRRHGQKLVDIIVDVRCHFRHWGVDVADSTMGRNTWAARSGMSGLVGVACSTSVRELLYLLTSLFGAVIHVMQCGALVWGFFSATTVSLLFESFAFVLF
jgi:hypothetical protein